MEKFLDKADKVAKYLGNVADSLDNVADVLDNVVDSGMKITGCVCRYSNIPEKYKILCKCNKTSVREDKERQEDKKRQEEYELKARKLKLMIKLLSLLDLDES